MGIISKVRQNAFFLLTCLLFKVICSQFAAFALSKVTGGKNKYGNAIGSRFVLTLSAIQHELTFLQKRRLR